ncbi:hypothetical protein DPMN_100580 [Dreissena polymorpha]|uniref:Uncharacterized protein n=1 Tax=Dreissena polymorpha TaxID=45954 RepID=A0A9D4LG10_DREPO|nr:hypothetical protein DPMN_100580 [Dreissena polymorpha]
MTPDGDDLYSDGRYAISVVWILLLIMGCIAAIIMLRTKRTTFETRLYAVVIIAFDSMFLLTIAIRELHTKTDDCIVHETLFGYSCNFMSAVAVMILSCVQLFSATYPQMYDVKCTGRLVTVATVLTLTAVYIIYWINEISSVLKGSGDHNHNAWDRLKNAMFPKNTIAFGIPLFVSLITRKKTLTIAEIQVEALNSRKGECITGTISHQNQRLIKIAQLLYVTFLTLIIVMFILLNIFVALKYISVQLTLVTLDALLTMDCAVNLLVHVFWYKECQFEAHGLFLPLSKTLRKKHSLMRYEIYEIVCIPIDKIPIPGVV